MNQVRLLLTFLLLIPAAAFAKAPLFHYLPPDAVDVRTFLSGPPAPGSPENNADLRAVLARQQSRTPSEIARARSEATFTPAAFGTVLGKGFTDANYPITFALLNAAGSDAELISESTKNFWKRPRPPLQDHAIHPVIPCPTSFSYPSGHAMRGALWSAILAELVPSHKTALLARGAQVGEDRIIAGVHFPTDVAAGQKLGRYLATRFFASPTFQRDLARARVECSASKEFAESFPNPKRIFWDDIWSNY
jgi:hypothetical protein